MSPINSRRNFRLSGTAADDRLQWTGGLYWFQEQAFNIDDVDFPFFEARSGSYVDNTSFAAFGQFSYDVSDRVSITLGARYTDEQLNDIVDDRVQFATALFNGDVTTPPDNVVLPDGYVFPVIAGYDYFALPPAAGSFKIVPNQNFESDYDDVNPYFSIAYDFTDALMGYVSYSEGFKGRRIYPAHRPGQRGERLFARVRPGLRGGCQVVDGPREVDRRALFQRTTPNCKSVPIGRSGERLRTRRTPRSRAVSWSCWRP